MDYLNRKLRFTFLTLFYIFVMALFSLVPSSTFSQNPFELSERIFNFGYVGIDYKISHTFFVKNTRRKPITIDSVKINCDCTTVKFEKKTINPGEKAEFRMTFDTKDFYGPVERNFQVHLSLPEKRVAQFFYLATIGQWYHGLKPEPFSVFMLPTQSQQVVKINNKEFEELTIEIASRYDKSFSLEITKETANKGKQVEVVVKPSDALKKGTYNSNFTLKVTAKELDEPIFLTIPVKIARF